MPETTQVNVKLPVSMKREWEDYVEESEEATSLSHLIRLAVQREISDEVRTAEVEVAADDIELDVNIEGIERRLDEMEDTLTKVRDSVNAMETGHLADKTQIEEIADRVYDTLPRRTTERVEEDLPELQPNEIAQTLVSDAVLQMEEFDKSIGDFAEEQNFEYGLVPVYQEYFGINDYEMHKVLERVEQMSSRVHVNDDYDYTVVFEVE